MIERSVNRAKSLIRRVFEREPKPQPQYVDNLLALGRLASTYGISKYPPSWMAIREIASTEDPTTGFTVSVNFLADPNTIWQLEARKLPNLHLTKRGPRTQQGLFAGTLFPCREVVIHFNADWLTTIEVTNQPSAQQYAAEFFKFKPPQETFVPNDPLGTRRQWTTVNEFYAYMTAEPANWCPRARRFLDKITSQALVEFQTKYPQLPQMGGVLEEPKVIPVLPEVGRTVNY